MSYCKLYKHQLINDFLVLFNTFGSSYLLPSRMSCLWVLTGGNKWWSLWFTSWISTNSFLHMSRRRLAKVGIPATSRASSYVASGIMILSARSWMFSMVSDCATVSPPCHTWQAYSTTGRTSEQYISKSLSTETFARLRILRKYSLCPALAVMESMWMSHVKLLLIVTPSNFVCGTFL